MRLATYLASKTSDVAEVPSLYACPITAGIIGFMCALFGANGARF